MSTIKISEMPVANAPTAGDIVQIVQDGVNKQTGAPGTHHFRMATGTQIQAQTSGGDINLINHNDATGEVTIGADSLIKWDASKHSHITLNQNMRLRAYDGAYKNLIQLSNDGIEISESGSEETSTIHGENIRLEVPDTGLATVAIRNTTNQDIEDFEIAHLGNFAEVINTSELSNVILKGEQSGITSTRADDSTQMVIEADASAKGGTGNIRITKFDNAGTITSNLTISDDHFEIDKPLKLQTLEIESADDLKRTTLETQADGTYSIGVSDGTTAFDDAFKIDPVNGEVIVSSDFNLVLNGPQEIIQDTLETEPQVRVNGAWTALSDEFDDIEYTTDTFTVNDGVSDSGVITKSVQPASSGMLEVRGDNGLVLASNNVTPGSAPVRIRLGEPSQKIIVEYLDSSSPTEIPVVPIVVDNTWKAVRNGAFETFSVAEEGFEMVDGAEITGLLGTTPNKLLRMTSIGVIVGEADEADTSITGSKVILNASTANSLVASFSDDPVEKVIVHDGNIGNYIPTIPDASENGFEMIEGSIISATNTIDGTHDLIKLTDDGIVLGAFTKLKVVANPNEFVVEFAGTGQEEDIIHSGNVASYITPPTDGFQMDESGIISATDTTAGTHDLIKLESDGIVIGSNTKVKVEADVGEFVVEFTSTGVEQEIIHAGNIANYAAAGAELQTGAKISGNDSSNGIHDLIKLTSNDVVVGSNTGLKLQANEASQFVVEFANSGTELEVIHAGNHTQYAAIGVELNETAKISATNTIDGTHDLIKLTDTGVVVGDSTTRVKIEADSFLVEFGGSGAEYGIIHEGNIDSFTAQDPATPLVLNQNISLGSNSIGGVVDLIQYDLFDNIVIGQDNVPVKIVKDTVGHDVIHSGNLEIVYTYGTALPNDADGEPDGHIYFQHI